MTEKTRTFNRKKALTVVLLIAAVLILLIFMRWHSSKSDCLSTTEGRQKFLYSLGWDVDIESEEEKIVLIPEKLEGVMEEYNKMQLEQGLDLSLHCGKKCSQFNYLLKNYPSGKEHVYLTIYVLKGRLIAGDIHTNSVNGFMQGILPAQ